MNPDTPQTRTRPRGGPQQKLLDTRLERNRTCCVKARMKGGGGTEEVCEDKTERKQRLLYELEYLLSWYRRPGQQASKEHGDTTGKKNVTSVISAAFRSASCGAPLKTWRLKWPTYMGTSTHLFQYVHASLKLVT